MVGLDVKDALVLRDVGDAIDRAIQIRPGLANRASGRAARASASGITICACSGRRQGNTAASQTDNDLGHDNMIPRILEVSLLEKGCPRRRAARHPGRWPGRSFYHNQSPSRRRSDSSDRGRSRRAARQSSRTIPSNPPLLTRDAMHAESGPPAFRPGPCTPLGHSGRADPLVDRPLAAAIDEPTGEAGRGAWPPRAARPSRSGNICCLWRRPWRESTSPRVGRQLDWPAALVRAGRNPAAGRRRSTAWPWRWRELEAAFIAARPRIGRRVAAAPRAAARSVGGARPWFAVRGSPPDECRLAGCRRPRSFWCRRYWAAGPGPSDLQCW